jgi:hypothetical protein
MISRVRFCDENLNEVEIGVGYQIDLYSIKSKRPDGGIVREFLPGPVSHVKWEDNNIEIEVEGISFAYPSVCLNYVIALSNETDGPFSKTNKVVIFNSKGAVHKRLDIPPLICERIVDRLKFLKVPNPPLKWAQEEGGLIFSGVKWEKNQKGVIVNALTIFLEQGTIEVRELAVEQGEFGECLHSSLAHYAKR